jgi:autotransporter-associated beta strand protein
MALPVLEDRKFLGSVVVDGTSTLTGNATFSGDVTISTGELSASELVTEVITDPGAGGAIPVTNSGSCAITTAASETRSIAIPTFPGQMLSITIDVYVASGCTITVAGAFNQTANTTLLGEAAGDHFVLIGCQVGGVLVWRLVVNDGWTLSTP